MNRRTAKLVRGFDNEFYAPHSRFQEVRAEDIKRLKSLKFFVIQKRRACISYLQKAADVFL